jgi:hypothetical protein
VTNDPHAIDGRARGAAQEDEVLSVGNVFEMEREAISTARDDDV